MKENGTTKGGAVRVKYYLDSWDERDSPPSEGWEPPLPFPYVMSYPLTYVGPDGATRDGATIELTFLRPSAFAERLTQGGAGEANRSISVSSDDFVSAIFGEPTFRPATEEGA